jgi:hypothetical protein
MKKSNKKKPTWTDLKSQLADLDRPVLLGLIQDLYAASKNNQVFLHARFDLGEENARLMELLIQHGIAWEEPAIPEPVPASTESAPAQTHFTTDDKIALFRSLFRGAGGCLPRVCRAGGIGRVNPESSARYRPSDRRRLRPSSARHAGAGHANFLEGNLAAIRRTFAPGTCRQAGCAHPRLRRDR